MNGQIQSCSPHCSSSQETLECSRQAKDLNLLLRRVLHLAIEWGVLESAPKIELLTGERRRERVVTAEEESRYLSAASPLLEAVATVLADTGLRPDECHRLRWEEISWANGRNGNLLVTRGKTAAARRVLPMAPRVRRVLESRRIASGRPSQVGFGALPLKRGTLTTQA